MGSYWSSYGID